MKLRLLVLILLCSCMGMQAQEVSTHTVTIDGRQYYIHTVGAGETLEALSRLYGLLPEEIVFDNPYAAKGLREGMLLKIPDRRRAYEYQEEYYIGTAENERLKISILLPLQGADGKVNMRFVEFYRGALLALEELKREGVSADVKVFDAPRSEERMRDIVHSEEFAHTGLVIGPVYPEGLECVMSWAEMNGAPVVSPLTTHEVMQGYGLYQMAPTAETKYDKIRALMAREGVNVVYVTTASPDKEMDEALCEELSRMKVIAHGRGTSGATFESSFDRRAEENIYVVSCMESREVDQILNKISSMHSHLTDRGVSSSRIRVVGNAQWAGFSPGSVDRELYFKVGVCYVTNYHVDRTDARVREFDERYIAAFGEIPPSAPAAALSVRNVRVYPYAYRGYDAIKLFAGAAGGGRYGPRYRLQDRLNTDGPELLQVSYLFEPWLAGDWRNVNWTLVCYRPDYSIEIE